MQNTSQKNVDAASKIRTDAEKEAEVKAKRREEKMRLITEDWLQEKSGCPDQIERFRLEWPHGAKAGMPKETIESGFPPETFTFTGDYSEQVAGAGSRMATRNKRITGYAPIYKNVKSETISDMSQIVKAKPHGERR